MKDSTDRALGIVELEITDLAYGGDGVGRLPEGKVVFVPYAANGDRLRVRLVEDKSSFARGQIDEILVPGAGRATPRCPYFRRCGGCQYQHLEPAVEHRAKLGQLRDVLERIGKFKALPETVHAPRAPEPYGYRNKLVLHPAGDGENVVGYGYHETDGTTILPIDQCPIAGEALQAELTAWEAEELKPVPVTLRLADNGRVFRFYGRPPKRAPWLREHVFGHTMNVPLGGFAQVNRAVAGQLVDWLREHVAADAANTLVDCYCGSGLFALTLGEGARRVIGIESHRPSLQAARFNAKRWPLAQAELHVGRVERVFSRLRDDLADAQPLTMILDPPRAGCDKRFLQDILACQPTRLVYVSCQPPTMARDLRRLTASGELGLSRLAMFDMFPQTAHFEAVAVLEATSGM